MRDPRPALISLAIFAAWLIAATGWVRVFAIIWLIYPGFVVRRVVSHRRIKLN